MVEADLVAYLDPLIAETAGTDLFEGPAPEQPDNVIAVAHYNSQASDDFAMAASLTAPDSELEDVQVMVRNTDRATGRARAHAIHALLDNLQDATLSGRKYSHITSDGPPFGLGQDATGRWRFAANYHVRKARG